MARQRLLSRRELGRLAIAFLLLVLLAAAANVPAAVLLIRPDQVPWSAASQLARSKPGPPMPKQWPSATPHQQPWPAPAAWVFDRAFGFWRYQVQAPGPTDGRNGFAMDVRQYGWPLPVLEAKQMWWDWDNPVLKGPLPNPPLRLMPAGTLLNPLIAAAAAFVVLFGPLVLFVVGRRAWRRQGGQCMHCGYPQGPWTRCPECGNATGAVNAGSAAEHAPEEHAEA